MEDNRFIKNNLGFSENIDAFDEKTPVHCDIMNEKFGKLLSNTMRLKKTADTSVGTYKWDVNSEAQPCIDEVLILKDGKWESTGQSLKEFENNTFKGVWFYVGNGGSEEGMTRYKLIADGYTNTGYQIDGANGYLNCRDYVIWLGRWVRFNVYETKASTVKNADGQYSPKSGVDGLMSSTDKAYLTDLIHAYWGKEKLPIYMDPDPPEGWQCNWLFDTGLYLGGIKKDCGGHPPVLNDNHTSWAVLVLNGMATDANSLNHNHRLQIAFDVVNSRIYMRRGWMSENTWADSWTDVGKIADGSITESMLSEELQTLINGHTNQIGALSDLDTTAKKNVVAAVNEVKAEAVTAVKIRGSLSSRIVSDDPNYNGYDFDSIPNVKPGDAFTVSADIATWWESANPPKAGDMIISIGDNSANASNWLIMRGTGATSALESRIVALERQLNGISFGVDTNGNLTYETQGEATE